MGITNKRKPDLLLEEPMLLYELGKIIPSRPCYETLRTWCTKGRKNKESSTIVVMESLLLPHGRASTLSAYWRFVRRLNSQRSRR